MKNTKMVVYIWQFFILASTLAYSNLLFAGETFIESHTGMEFVWVPGGCFDMGQSAQNIEQLKNQESLIVHRNSNRYIPKFGVPIRKICLKGFWLGKYEVTNRQYRLYNPKHDSGKFQGHTLNTEDQPVVNIRWSEALQYAEWLSKKTGKNFRIPTEAEWEYAARGEKSTLFYWGDSIDPACQYENIADINAKQFSDYFEFWHLFKCNDTVAVSANVGKFLPNGFGLHDMMGNVSEYCWAWLNNYNSSQADPTDPHSYSVSAGQILRGGNWYGNYPRMLSPAWRVTGGDGGSYSIGFRLLLQVVR